MQNLLKAVLAPEAGTPPFLCPFILLVGIKVVTEVFDHFQDYDAQTRLELIHRKDEDKLYEAFDENKKREDDQFERETKVQTFSFKMHFLAIIFEKLKFKSESFKYIFVKHSIISFFVAEI